MRVWLNNLVEENKKKTNGKNVVNKRRFVLLDNKEPKINQQNLAAKQEIIINLTNNVLLIIDISNASLYTVMLE